MTPVVRLILATNTRVLNTRVSVLDGGLHTYAQQNTAHHYSTLLMNSFDADCLCSFLISEQHPVEGNFPRVCDNTIAHLLATSEASIATAVQAVR